MSFDFGGSLDSAPGDVPSDVNVDPQSPDYGGEQITDSPTEPGEQVSNQSGNSEFVNATDPSATQTAPETPSGYQNEASQLADGNGVAQPSAIDKAVSGAKDAAASAVDKAEAAVKGLGDKVTSAADKLVANAESGIKNLGDQITKGADSLVTKIEDQFSAKNLEAFATKTAKNLVASAENLVINTAKNYANQALSTVVGPAAAAALTNGVTRSLTGPATTTPKTVSKNTDPTAGGAFVETSPGVFVAKADRPPADDPNAPLVEIPPPGDKVATTAKSVNPTTDPTAGGEFVETSPGVFVAKADIPPADDPNAPLVAIPPPASAVDKSAANVGYVTGQDAENGTYYVKNEQTGAIVASGLTEQQAMLKAQDQTFVDAGDVPLASTAANQIVKANTPGTVNDPNLATVPANTIGTVTGAVGAAANTALADAASRTQGLIRQAQNQQTARVQNQNKAQAGDWRVRLSLAPTSNYLYNAPDCGPVLWPLYLTNGVIFPYTPTIDTSYKANYTPYDLTHSNYRGYFYQSSYIDGVNIKATFTAQDTTEANYLLAVIHFFRSVTKMFYGQDAQRGSPPPLVFLSGLGDFQFNQHPCVVSQFNYNLPADVNYIRAQSVPNDGTNQLAARMRQTTLGNPVSNAIQRLASLGQGIRPGALTAPFAPQGSLGANNPTYVPTKMEISLTLLPIQSRSQVSQQFSLAGFANGNQLKGGFW